MPNPARQQVVVPISRVPSAPEHHARNLESEIKKACHQMFITKYADLASEKTIDRLSRQYNISATVVQRWALEGGWHDERERGRVLRVAKIQEIENRLKALKTKDRFEHLRAAWHGMRDVEKSLKRNYGDDFGSIRSHQEAMSVWERIVKVESHIRFSMGIPNGRDL